jgi:hypothetical protein
MQSLQPQSLTNEELKGYAQLIGADSLPANWVTEILRRTEKNWAVPTKRNSAQIELDFS